jgi:hypothetical protein
MILYVVVLSVGIPLGVLAYYVTYNAFGNKSKGNKEE